MQTKEQAIELAKQIAMLDIETLVQGESTEHGYVDLPDDAAALDLIAAALLAAEARGAAAERAKERR